MAIQVHYDGPVLVKLNSVDLGYTSDGVIVTIEPRWNDVFSDDYGGERGAPADAQILGGIGRANIQLAKYDRTYLENLTSFGTTAGTAGTFPAYGTLIRQESIAQALVLSGTNRIQTFSKSFVRGSQEWNSGTRHKRWSLSLEMWVDAATTRALAAFSAPA